MSLPSSPFFDLAGDAAGGLPPRHPRRQLSRALSSHLDRCMSTHSYHARARGGPAASSSPAHASVIAAALGTRALRFSFVDGDGEVEEEGLEADEFEVAHAVAPSSFSPSSAALPPPPPRGTVLDGAAIIFTAVASFPARSLPWSVSTMGWTGLAALTLCGVAPAFYS